MKKNAFTLIELLATLVILGIISTIAVTSYTRYINNSKTESYTKGEETMRAAAESFITYCNTNTFNLPASCPVIPESGSSVTIALSDLVNEGFMDPIVDQEKSGTCSGSVTVYNKSETASVNYNLCYDVTLTCSNYQTDSSKWNCE